MVVYSCCCVESFESVLVNCLQFCRVIRAWISERRTSLLVDCEWIVTLWQSSILAVFDIHRSLYILSKRGKGFYLDNMSLIDVSIQEDQLDDSWRMDITIKDMLEIIDVSSSVLLMEPCTVAITPRQQLQTLLIYKQIYFEHFIHEVNYKADITIFAGLSNHNLVVRSAIARQQLMDVLYRITEVISHIPNMARLLNHAQDIERYLNKHTPPPSFQFNFLRRFPPLFGHDNSRVERPDIYFALIYFSATLFTAMLDPHIDYKENSQRLMFHSALALCRLVHGSRRIDADNFSLIRRSIFWAGLVLTNTRYPVGNALQEIGANASY